MTTEQFYNRLNDTYGISHPWPTVIPVDRETYYNLLRDTMRWCKEHKKDLTFGVNGGFFFKNVEIVLEG